MANITQLRLGSTTYNISDPNAAKISDIPTKTSQLTNDSNFVTADNVVSNTAGTTNSTSILYLAGATTQATNPQTYSNSAIKANCNSSGSAETGSLTATKIYGAVWNDYAEYRKSETIEPGRVICENGDDTLSLSKERLQPGANIVSDTYGFAIGETDNAKTPIAVSGRVLVYTYEDRNSYKPGDAVCAAPGGTISKMSREEIMTYPERIVGTVSAIPNYETWGENNILVDGRIWVKVK